MRGWKYFVLCLRAREWGQDQRAAYVCRYITRWCPTSIVQDELWSVSIFVLTDAPCPLIYMADYGAYV